MTYRISGSRVIITTFLLVRESGSREQIVMGSGSFNKCLPTIKVEIGLVTKVVIDASDGVVDLAGSVLIKA